MRLLDELIPRPTNLSVDDYAQMFRFNGNQYAFGIPGSNPNQPVETFQGYIDGIHRKNGVVSAAVATRAMLLSQLRFVWRQTRGGTNPGELSSTPALDLLEQPGSATRNNLLFQMEQDASYAGTAYLYRDGKTLRRLMPDRCAWLLGSDSEPDWDGDQMRLPYDAQVVGLIYRPDKHGDGGNLFLPGQFAAWSPEPDPIYWWRGQSWVTSVVQEIVLDEQVTDHFDKFFQHAATPNLVFMMDPSKTSEQVKEYAKVVNETHAGAMNSFKNMFLGGGTDVKVVGSSLDKLGARDLQGGLENRVATRSRVPAVILGTRESGQGSGLQTGFYGSARRMLADGWFTPSALSLCAALQAVLPAARNQELWFDPAEVLFLQEDRKDAAEIMQVNAAALRQLWDGGADPQSAIDYIASGDVTKLEHSGDLSVQLQPPGTTTE